MPHPEIDTKGFMSPLFHITVLKKDQITNAKQHGIDSYRQQNRYTNKGQNPHNHLISIDTGKAFDNTQHLSMIKTLRKLGMEGNFLNPKKGIYEKNPQLTRYLMVNRTECFPTKIRNETRMPTCAPSILARAIRQEKGIGDIQLGKGEIKVSLFPQNLILYFKNSEGSQKNY